MIRDIGRTQEIIDSIIMNYELHKQLSQIKIILIRHWPVHF